ncbi:hypothetical protein ACVWXO_000912 [Bradyrhizobium sp. LM2.7]
MGEAAAMTDLASVPYENEEKLHKLVIIAIGRRS